MYKEIIEYLENKIKRCEEFGDMKKEKWAFQTTLKEVRKLSERQENTETSEQHGNKALHIADVSKRFSKGAIWQNDYDKSIIKVIEEDWIGQKVKMIDGTVFSKIFLSKYYKFIGNAC